MQQWIKNGFLLNGIPPAVMRAMDSIVFQMMIAMSGNDLDK